MKGLVFGTSRQAAALHVSNRMQIKIMLATVRLARSLPSAVSCNHAVVTSGLTRVIFSIVLLLFFLS